MNKLLSLALVCAGCVLPVSTSLASGWGRIITPVLTTPAQPAVVTVPVAVPATTCGSPAPVVNAYYGTPVTVARPVVAAAPVAPIYYPAPVTVYRPTAVVAPAAGPI